MPLVEKEFHSDNILLAGFVVSVYVLGYASGPLVIAPLSELYGRCWVYNISNIIFVIFSIACAVSTSQGMLIGFRYLAGVVGSTVITIGGGTVGDLFVQEERGKAMSLWSLGPLLGPVVGPVAGGFLGEAAGWRWIFWLCAIAAGLITVPFLLFNKETYAPVLLERKAKRLRKETGNPNLRSKMDTGLTPGPAFKMAIIRPLRMLIFSPICLFLAIYVAVVYGYLYLLFTTLTEVFQLQYHWKTGVAGLSFLGIGIGNFVGVAAFALGSDRSLKKRKARGEEIKPEHRLPLLIPAGLFVPIGFFIYGKPPTDLQALWYMLTCLRLVSRISRPLVCSHIRDSLRRRRSHVHLHAHPNLPRRCFHHLRLLGHCRQYRLALHCWRGAPAGRAAFVQESWLRMG